MMKRIMYRWLLAMFMCLVCAGPVVAQSFKDDLARLHGIANRIKNLRVYSYSYELTERTEDSTEQVKGSVLCDMDNRVFYNSCPEFDMFCNDTWFYRAVHKDKEVFMFRLDQKYDEEQKQLFLEQIFSNNAPASMIDSLVLKHGTVTGYRTGNHITEVVLSFPPGLSSMEKVSLKYDERLKLPKELVFYTSYTRESPFSTPVRIHQTIRCFDYATTLNRRSLEDLFSSKNDKVVLRKYKNYKIITP